MKNVHLEDCSCGIDGEEVDRVNDSGKRRSTTSDLAQNLSRATTKTPNNCEDELNASEIEIVFIRPCMKYSRRLSLTTNKLKLGELIISLKLQILGDFGYLVRRILNTIVYISIPNLPLPVLINRRIINKQRRNQKRILNKLLKTPHSWQRNSRQKSSRLEPELVHNQF